MYQLKILSLTILLATAWIPQSLPTESITAGTLPNLSSDAWLNFAALHEEGLATGAGVFVTNQDASRVATFAHKPEASPLSTAVIWNGYTGELIKTFPIGDNPYDRTLSANGAKLAVARPDGVVLFDIATEQETKILQTESPVLELWFTSNSTVCSETTDGQVVCSDNRTEIPLFGGKSSDFARIGRVPPPLAVTVSQHGDVTQWNLETGERLRQAQADDIAVFGAVNIHGSPTSEKSGSHLAWRDPMSEGLFLLDFASNTNRHIDALQGEYITHILLSHDASVIFGIAPMSAREAIWAWETATGKKTEVGSFHPCEREQPDLARLSFDGTALLIGCDTGIDIWRIQ